MKLQLVRHATLLLHYAGRRILVDPMLGDPGTAPAIPGTPSARPNPLIPLPMPAAAVAENLDALIVTHLHRDHWDPAAANLLPKDLPLFCQPGDEQRLREPGFTRVQPVEDALDWGGIELVRTGGKHGVGLIGKAMGKVSGFVLRAPGEPTLYIAGDTVWCGCVRETLETLHPDVVVLNAGAAQFLVGTPITMTAADVARVCTEASAARVVAVHMDAINHCLLTRPDLRAALAQQGLSNRVHVPADGETLEFPGA